MSATPELLAPAKRYHDGGLSLVATGRDKKPIRRWKSRQTERFTWEQIERELRSAGVYGVAVIAGAVSGGVEVLDFDEPGFREAWRDAVGELCVGLPEQQTQSGMYQVAWRCDSPGPSTALAWVPDDNVEDGRRIGIETRGEKGYAVLPESQGPTGTYRALSGDFANIPRISMERRNALIEAARKLCCCPLTRKQRKQQAKALASPPRKPRAGDGHEPSVIDQWNRAHPIDEVLKRYGYTPWGSNRFTRPGEGATPGGVFIFENGKSFHHSTNDKLHDGRAHDSFDVFCEWEHDGDVCAAVKAAAAELGITREETPVGSAFQHAQRNRKAIELAPELVECLTDQQQEEAKAIFAQGNGHKPKIPPETQADIDAALAKRREEKAANRKFLLTDAGNAERFAKRWRCELRYDAVFGRWRYYDGRRWVVDEVGRAIKAAKSITRGMLRDSITLEGDERERLIRHAIKCESRERLSAMVDLARAEPDMTVVADQWDRDPWSYNCENGTIDLRSGELRPHRAEDLITKLSPVKYDRAARAPRLAEFLNEIFAGDQSLIDYIQRWHGYSLAAIRSEHIIPVYYGAGANGKSTFLDTLAYLMGDYADQAPPDLLTDSNGADRHPTEVADLRGKRLVVASETEKNRRLKIQLIKRLTGDEFLKGRFMRQDFFTFRRAFSLVLVTNNKPRVDEDSEAVWRRIRLIPFNVVIPPERRDKSLTDRLKAEGPGILAWLVQGCLDWQRDGLGEPESVANATAGYRAESDPIADFLDECCVLAPNAWAPSDSLRRVYERFCEERGEHPIGGNDWRDALHHHGAEPLRKHAGRGWSGIGILAPGSVPEEVEA